MKKWLTDLRFITILSCLLLSLATSFIAAHRTESRLLEESKDELAKRIALDLPELRLANPIFKQSADASSIRQYIADLNHHLTALRHPLRLLSIQDSSIELEKIKDTIEMELSASRQVVNIKVARIDNGFAFSTIGFPLFFTFLVGILIFSNDRYHKERNTKASPEDARNPSKLVVDLHERTIYLNNYPDSTALLSNKPLCFYLAMLKYCQDNEEAKLYHNKNLPEDFIELANKYFYRLLELGHSRRKRPDFDSNVDKMLSEIRAALDEVLHQEPDLKTKFYPQKAQGEGSRSKLHNFALINIKIDDYELIGN